MSIGFGKVTGPTGPTGPTGDTGPAGPQGVTGGPYSSTILRDGYSMATDIRRNRFGYFVQCNTADDAELSVDTTTVVKRIYETDLYYGYLPSGNLISSYSTAGSYGALYAVYFVYGQTTPRKVQLMAISSHGDSIIGYSSYTVYVNGVITSATNPLLWQPGSILLFAFSSKAYYLGYLGNVQSAALNRASVPLFYYKTMPAESSLPVKPCLYYVGSNNSWHYCNGL